MTLAQALRKHLAEQTGVAVYPVRLPQQPTYPCLTYFVLAEDFQTALDRRTLVDPSYQISCWGLTYEAADALRLKVREALLGFQSVRDGPLGGALGVSVLRVLSEGRGPDLYEELTPSQGVFQIPNDFNFLLDSRAETN